MTDLITRLSKLDAPDREVDWLIADHFAEIPKHTIREIGWDYDWWRGPNEYSLKKAIDSEGRRIETWHPNAYTASVDAAIALAEKVLPGWGFFLRSDKDGHNCGMVYPVHNFVTPGTASGATAAISMCIAVLRAKEASK